MNQKAKNPVAPPAKLVKLGRAMAIDPSTVLALYIKQDPPDMVVWIARTSGLTIRKEQVYDKDLEAAFEKLFDAVNALREDKVPGVQP
jgi:hypothetical protein